jgi:hypothetical protein
MANTTQELTVTGSSINALINDELIFKMSWAFYFVIYPIISIIGIAANVSSVVIISRKGFKISSNILLVALAVSDILFLIGLNNFVRTIIFLSDLQALLFSETINYVFYIFYSMFSMFYNIGVSGSMLIPVLITGERVLAVFTPLTFARIVTPIRTVCVISFITIIIIICSIYNDLVCLEFKQISVQGVSIGVFFYTEQYMTDVKNGLYEVFAECFNNMTGAVPVVLVTVGSVAIGAKVSIINNKRKQLTSGGVPTTKKQTSQTNVSKTTKTLLSICILYIICSGFGFLVDYAIISTLNARSLRIILKLFKDLLISANSIGNFIIYVAVNKTLKTTNMRYLRC